MFNFLSQHISCDYEASQPLFNAASQVCSIASCGPGLGACLFRGGSRGFLGVRTPPPPFWGTTKLCKEGRNVTCVCAQKCCVLVLSCYPDPPFPKSCIRPCLYRVCCQSISETLNESRKRTRTFSGLFVRISTFTYCIPYIPHVHDSIVVCFSNISAYFAQNAESLITQESSRKSCSYRRFRSNPFLPRRPGRSVLVAIEF